MKNRLITHLSRRERQIMDIIYQKSEATVAEVRESLPNPPSYSSVRALLAVLENKGYLKHKEERRRYIYCPTIALEKVKRSALKHLLETFFEDSTEGVIAALLDIQGVELSEEELERISRLIEEAKKEGK
jgi:BlaI family penicillinase repressor